MKRIVLLTAGVAALVFSGLAVAHATLSHSIKGVSATFTAATVSNLRTSSCIGAEGNPFTYTRATYSGMATSTDATLNGPVTLDLSSYINTTTGYGTVAGKLRITTANNGLAFAALAATARIDRARDELAIVFPQSPAQLAGPAATMAWPDEPFTRGGYAVYKPSQLSAFWEPLRAGTDRIQFAGEHTEALAGYMESAVRSGIRIATRLGSPPS